MVSKRNERLAITKSSGNVFSDLGLPDAEKYLAEAELARQIRPSVNIRPFCGKH